MRSIATALLTIRRSPYQALASILLLSVTFFVAYVFSVFLYGADKVLKHFETRPQIIAFFELEADQTAIAALADTMRSKSYVQEVKLVSKDEALSIYRQEYKDDPLLTELVTADILPASIEVSAQSIESLNLIREDLENVAVIDDIVYQQDIIESLSNLTSSIRLIGITAVLLLGSISFLIIMVIIGIKVVHQKHAITIMRLIGATTWFVKRPFIMEGILYGLLGSIIGWSAMYGGIVYATPWIRSFLGEIQLLPIPFELLVAQLAVGTVVGMLLSGMAGLVAVQRILKK